MMPRGVEQALGAVITLLVLVDVFLTVLYARMGTSILGRFVARTTWRVFRASAKHLGRFRTLLLSFCGPVILVLLVATWSLGLTLGAALVIHPVLGTSIRATAGPTPTDFASALLAGAGSISIVHEGDLIPRTTPTRLLYVINSLIGASMLSLTLTYLMQVYSALRDRNVLGLKIHLQTGETGDAAELVAGWGPEGRFGEGHTSLTDMAVEMSATKEAHHFYPVLFFFRFHEPLYALARLTLIALDTVSLIKSALDDEEYAWLKESASTEQLWRAAIILSSSLEETFHLEAAEPGPPDAEERARWDRRYAAAVRRLRQAGIRTREDGEEGAAIYARLRTCWDHHVARLAPAMDYDLEEIDPAGTHPEASDARPPFRGRRTAPA